MAESAIIIGGGPSGIMAAIQLAHQGKKVILLEKNKELGRKIQITGNGRCNITNSDLDISHYHGENPLWAYPAITEFNNYALLGFFEDLGVTFKEESDGRYFTTCSQASAVVTALEEELSRLGVNLVLDTQVLKVSQDKSQFIVYLKYDEKYFGDQLVISAGGRSYPRLGSSGDGYLFAQNFGHRIVPPSPSLVPLEIAERWIRGLQGLRWDVTLQLHQGDLVLAESYGEILFRPFGISGPATLAISREAGRVKPGSDTLVKINFFPNYSEEDLYGILCERWNHRPDWTLARSLIGILPDRIGLLVVEQGGFDPQRKVAQLKKADRRRVTHLLQNTEVTLDKPRSFAESQVTAGGVSTAEVDSKTMESLLIPGLFFTGEVLDIDGDSGGYNLQFAFSTGALIR